MITVLHADDHEIVRTGVKNFITSQTTNINVVAGVSNYLELYTYLLHSKVDLLILDSQIPNGTCEENLPRLRSLYPNMKILLFSLGVDSKSWKELGQWLDGQLNLNNSDFLVTAIETLMKGEKFITP